MSANVLKQPIQRSIHQRISKGVIDRNVFDIIREKARGYS
jgi:hypothetical protein